MPRNNAPDAAEGAGGADGGDPPQPQVEHVNGMDNKPWPQEDLRRIGLAVHNLPEPEPKQSIINMILRDQMYYFNEYIDPDRFCIDFNTLHPTTLHNLERFLLANAPDLYKPA